MLKAGIIGLGRIGIGFTRDPKRGKASTHVGSYELVEGVQLVAACDTNLQALNDAETTCRCYLSAGDMFHGHPDLDIVSICTPPDQHLPCVRQAVAAGARAIFCEKPIADTVEAGEEMVELCKAMGVRLLIDHQRRFSPLHQAAAELVRSGKMGRIQGGWAWYTAGLFNSGTHLVDLLRLYLGNASLAQGHYSSNLSWREDDPNVEGIIRFYSGPDISLHAFDHKAYATFGFTILGTEGKLTTVNNGMGLSYWGTRENGVFSGYNELYPDSLPVRDVKETDRLIPLGIEMIRDSLNGKSVPIRMDGRDGLEALKTLHALRESAEKGKVVWINQSEPGPITQS